MCLSFPSLVDSYTRHFINPNCYSYNILCKDLNLNTILKFKKHTQDRNICSLPSFNFEIHLQYNVLFFKTQSYVVDTSQTCSFKAKNINTGNFYWCIEFMYVIHKKCNPSKKKYKENFVDICGS